MEQTMKRKFLVLALLAVGVVAVTTGPASAWGFLGYRLLGSCFPNCFPGHHLSRYVNVQICQPYNAFTPFTGGYSHAYGVTNASGFGGPCGACGGGCGPCGPCSLGAASPMGFPCGPVCSMPYTPGAQYAQIQYPQMQYPQMPMMPAPLMQATAPYGGYNPGYYGYGVQPVGYYPMSYPMQQQQFPMRNAFGN
jgi:hypothetical protein